MITFFVALGIAAAFGVLAVSSFISGATWPGVMNTGLTIVNFAWAMILKGV